jgi:hypothetical protein
MLPQCHNFMNREAGHEASAEQSEMQTLLQSQERQRFVRRRTLEQRISGAQTQVCLGRTPQQGCNVMRFTSRAGALKGASGHLFADELGLAQRQRNDCQSWVGATR